MEFNDYPLHDSIRGWFGRALYFEMQKNEDIWLILPDLGYKLFDLHLRDFPERVKSIGASEQAALGIAVGLALQKKIPVVYSITTFLIYRGFEWTRNYLQHEGIAVRLVGSGFEADYAHDGVTHQPWEVEQVMHHIFPQIATAIPWDKNDIPELVRKMIATNRPSFLCLRR